MKTAVPKNSNITDPDMPKKPTTAYILYFKSRKEKYLSEYPNSGITDITKLIAKEWGELPREKQIVRCQKQTGREEKLKKINKLFEKWKK